VTDVIDSFCRTHGYALDTLVLNAVDYGVPQKRKRVFFVGILDGTGGVRPTPAPCTETVKDRLDDLTNADENAVPNHRYTRHSPETVRRLAAVPQGGRLYPYSSSWVRLREDAAAPTVKAFVGNKSEVLKLIGNAVPRGLARGVGLAVRDELKK